MKCDEYETTQEELVVSDHTVQIGSIEIINNVDWDTKFFDLYNVQRVNCSYKTELISHYFILFSLYIEDNSFFFYSSLSIPT